MFKPSNNQARQINSLITKRKFNINILLNNILKEFFLKNIKLFNSALNIIYKIEITSK